MKKETISVLGILFVTGYVASSPIDNHTIRKRVNNLPLIGGGNGVEDLKMLKNKRWKLVPVKVEQVESYQTKSDEAYQSGSQPQAKNGAHSKRSGEDMSVSQASSRREFSSNINGNQKSRVEEKEKIMKNGELVGSVDHTANEIQSAGGKPHSQEITELDFPWMNVHERLVEKDGQQYTEEQEEAQDTKDVASTLQTLATYIEETGDENTVVSFLESLIQSGKLTEDKALLYSEAIQQIMNEDENTREAEEEEVREEEAGLILNLSDFLDMKLNTGKINQKVYNDLKGRLMSTVLEIARDDPGFLSGREDGAQ